MPTFQTYTAPNTQTSKYIRESGGRIWAIGVSDSQYAAFYSDDDGATFSLDALLGSQNPQKMLLDSSENLILFCTSGASAATITPSFIVRNKESGTWGSRYTAGFYAEGGYYTVEWDCAIDSDDVVHVVYSKFESSNTVPRNIYTYSFDGSSISSLVNLTNYVFDNDPLYTSIEHGYQPRLVLVSGTMYVIYDNTKIDLLSKVGSTYTWNVVRTLRYGTFWGAGSALLTESFNVSSTVGMPSYGQMTVRGNSSNVISYNGKVMFSVEQKTKDNAYSWHLFEDWSDTALTSMVNGIQMFTGGEVLIYQKNNTLEDMKVRIDGSWETLETFSVPTSSGNAYRCHPITGAFFEYNKHNIIAFSWLSPNAKIYRYYYFVSINLSTLYNSSTGYDGVLRFTLDTDFLEYLETQGTFHKKIYTDCGQIGQVIVTP